MIILQEKMKSLLKLNGEKITITLGRLLTCLLLIKPLVMLGIDVLKEDLYFEIDLTQGSLEKYFNYLLKRVIDIGIDNDFEKIRVYFIEAMNEMCDLSGEFNVKVGRTVSYRDFLRMEVEDPEAEKLFSPEVNSGSFSDIEKQFSAHSKKLMKYLREHDSELKPFICSETGINGKQLTQCIGFIGLKPDMDGNVIPVTISDNFLNGLTGLESYFISSKGTRKALTTNNRMTKRSGLR